MPGIISRSSLILLEIIIEKGKKVNKKKKKDEMETSRLIRHSISKARITNATLTRVNCRRSTDVN